LSSRTTRFAWYTRANIFLRKGVPLQSRRLLPRICKKGGAPAYVGLRQGEYPTIRDSTPREPRQSLWRGKSENYLLNCVWLKALKNDLPRVYVLVLQMRA